MAKTTTSASSPKEPVAITQQLGQWINNYRANKEKLPVITNSFFLNIQRLRAFIDQVEKEGGTFLRGYFVRFDMNNPPVGVKNPDWPGSFFIEAGNGLTQVSVAFVPVKNYRTASDDHPNGGGDDFLLTSGPVVFLPGGETTGTCPSNCGGSVGGNS